MIKLIGLLKRKSDMSHEEFKKFCLTEDAEKTKKLPGIIRFSHCFVDEKLQGELEIDGLVELWFDSRESMDKAFKSPEGQAAIALEPMFLEANTLNAFVTEEHEWIAEKTNQNQIAK